MTLIIATVTETFAMLTQDTGCIRPDDEAADPGFADVTSTIDFEAARRSSFSVPVAAPACSQAATVVKIAEFPSFKMAVGGAGHLDFHIAHLTALSEQLPMSATIDDMPLIAGNVLRQLRQQRETSTPYVAVFVGWSDTLGHPVAWSFTSGENFSAKRTGPGEGHILMPACDTADPEYAALFERSPPASKPGAGMREVEAFHSGYARNVWRACRQGLYGARMAIAGPFTSAVISREGVARCIWYPAPEGRVVKWSNPAHLAAPDQD